MGFAETKAVLGKGNKIKILIAISDSLGIYKQNPEKTKPPGFPEGFGGGRNWD